jgi:hypothetical protein
MERVKGIEPSCLSQAEKANLLVAFSASCLAIPLRQRLMALTGPMLRLGFVAIATRAGLIKFTFVEKRTQPWQPSKSQAVERCHF